MVLDTKPQTGHETLHTRMHTMCEPHADALRSANCSAAFSLVQRSLVEAAAVCEHRTSSFECGQEVGLAGCFHSVGSRAALLHSPAVEACIRMGHWWNRRYCDGNLRRPPTTPHLVNATSGAPVSLPKYHASRIATFTTQRWPFDIAAASDLVVAIEPADSVGPGVYPCIPVLAASRVSAFSRNQSYSRHDPDVILWAGTNIGFDNLASSSSAFYDDVPWAQKKDKIVWRGGLNGCWARDGACPNRDLHSAPVQSHASRLQAWRQLHSSELADVEYNGMPAAFRSKRSRPRFVYNSYARLRFDLAVRQLTHFFPERFDKRKATSYMNDVLAMLANASSKLCHVLPCSPGMKPAVLSPGAQSGYKIILQIDGESFPSSAVWTQLTSSVVMAPVSSYSTYADIGMLPWVHFIPTAMDFSDAEQHARWCFTHDRKCKAIGAAGRAHMLRMFEAPHAPRNGPGGDTRRHLKLSPFERKVNEIIIAHLVVNARRC